MMQRTLLATLVLAVGLFAQDGADPFAASDSLRRGEPSRSRATLPSLSRTGFIEDKDKNAIALLEIDGKQTHLLRKGDTITLSAGNVLKVTELNHREIHLEIAGRKMVVR